MLKLSAEDMFNAMAMRNKHRDGNFYYRPITTAVLCRARVSRAEILRFFQNIKMVMAAGFRSYRRGLPAIGLPSAKNPLIAMAQHLEQHAAERLRLTTLATLVERSSSQLQCIVEKVFGVSSKDYQNALWIWPFKHLLQQAGAIAEVVYASACDSINQASEPAAGDIGLTSKAGRAKTSAEIITYTLRFTDLGLLLMAATEKGVCFIELGDDANALVARLRLEFIKAELVKSEFVKSGVVRSGFVRSGLLAASTHHSSQLGLWINALARHIDKGTPRPDLPLDIRGTAFQVRVWQFLLSTREGDILSYGDVAVQIDKPKAARAVASACARNRIGILIPCHRVLRSDGGLGGYRWGITRKQSLLEAEKRRRLDR
jgi:AraC family transcriptional regulator of adaptative response/methylated-DNA-[protein]-cysteine methyltransferase